MKVTYYANEFVKKAAQDALDVQNASNSIGVGNTLMRHMVEMNRNCEVKTIHGRHSIDSPTMSQHPVIILFLDKLGSLARVQDLSNPIISNAYAACNKLAAGEDVEWEVQI
jgi:hypothetical protein